MGIDQNKAYKGESGFTLIETLIIIIIASLLTTAVVGQLRVSDFETRRMATEERLDKIDEAISIFIRRNSRMVCPAPFGVGEDTAFYARENLDTSGTFPVTLDCIPGTAPTNPGVLQINDNGGSDTIRIGMVPTRSLNLSDEYMYDGWGNPFTFAVAATLTSNAPDPMNPGFTFYESNFGTIQLVNGDNGGGDELSSDHMYIVISHGENQNGYRTAGSTARIGFCDAADNPPNVPFDDENCDDDGTFRVRSSDLTDVTNFNLAGEYSNSGGNNSFDDHFRAGTKQTLVQAAINKYILDEMTCDPNQAVKSQITPDRGAAQAVQSIIYVPTDPNALGENCTTVAFAGTAYSDNPTSLTLNTVDTSDGIPDVFVQNNSCWIPLNTSSPPTAYRDAILLYSRTENSGSEGDVTIRTTVPVRYNNLYTTDRATDNDPTTNGDRGEWEQAIQIAIYVDSDGSGPAPPELRGIGDLINPEHNVLNSSGSTGSVVTTAPINLGVDYTIEIYLFCLGSSSATAGNRTIDQVSAWAGTIRLEDYATDGYVEIIESGFQ